MLTQKDVRTDPQRPSSAAGQSPTISGKLVIITIATLALLGAGSSWWFRYTATHRAAQFWGPEASTLIRDAPLVSAFDLQAVDPPVNVGGEFVPIGDRTWRVASGSDISHARGLIHLRTALIEDTSYDWPQHAAPPNADWRFGLSFRRDAEAPPLVLYFTADFRNLAVAFASAAHGAPLQYVSCEPIAPGLAEMFAEFAQPSADKQ